MDRFIATTVLLFALLQAQTMLVGAFQISTRTDWQRLGAYCQQQVSQLYAEMTAPAPSKPVEPAPARSKPSKAMFVDSSAVDDAAKQKTGE